MQSVASFSTIKANLVHYLKISGLLKDGKELFFQFDKALHKYYSMIPK